MTEALTQNEDQSTPDSAEIVDKSLNDLKVQYKNEISKALVDKVNVSEDILNAIISSIKNLNTNLVDLLKSYLVSQPAKARKIAQMQRRGHALEATLNDAGHLVLISTKKPVNSIPNLEELEKLGFTSVEDYPRFGKHGWKGTVVIDLNEEPPASV